MLVVCVNGTLMLGGFADEHSGMSEHALSLSLSLSLLAFRGEEISQGETHQLAS